MMPVGGSSATNKLVSHSKKHASPMPSVIDLSSVLGKLLLRRGFVPMNNDLSISSALGWTAMKSYDDLARLIIDEGADTNVKDHLGMCPLHHAARYGSCTIIRILVDAGADLNVEENQGLQAVSEAAEHGQLDAISLLLDMGADVEHQDSEGKTPLHYAAQEGHTAVIRLLIESGANVNSQNKKGSTPLILSSINGRVEAIGTLLDLGADMECRDIVGGTALYNGAFSGQTAIVKYLLNRDANGHTIADKGFSVMHAAASTRSSSVLKLLLDHGFDPEVRAEDYMTPLMCAALNGNTDNLRLLLDRYPEVLESRDSRDESALHRAAERNNIESLQFLLERRAEIDASNFQHDTPLHLAVHFGNIECIRMLVEHSANVDAVNLSGQTPLYLAVCQNRKAIVNFLLRSGANMEIGATDALFTPVHKAAFDGTLDVLSLLLSNGANPNARTTADLFTPLHWAAYQGQVEAARLLLDAGADPTALDSKWRDAASYAHELQHPAIADLISSRTIHSGEGVRKSSEQAVTRFVAASGEGNLIKVRRFIKQGIDVNSRDLDGRTALSRAAEQGQEAIVAMLMDKGADQACQDAHGETALWWASRYGHVKVVELLLPNDTCPVFLADNEGRTPLHVSALKGHEVVVSLLLEHGADVHAKNMSGWTPLLAAAYNGVSPIIEMLIEAGSDLNYRSAFHGDTALAVASGQGHSEAVKTIQDYLEAFAVSLDDEDSGKMAEPLRFEKGVEAQKIQTRRQENLAKASGNGLTTAISRMIYSGVQVSGDALLHAASMGQDEAVTLLLDHGASIEHRNDLGNMALHLAAKAGCTSTVELLHKAGSRQHIDMTTFLDGRTPLSLASSGGHLETVELLLRLGASTDIKDYNHCTALYYAVQLGDASIVEALIRHGANVDQYNFDASLTFYTPLLKATELGFSHIAELLLKKGAQMLPLPGNNQSPLCLAAWHGHDVLVNLLIDHGAELDYVADNHQTALSFAAEAGHGMVVQILIEAGADVNLASVFGQSPLSLAKSLCHEAIVDLLYRAVSLRDRNERAVWKTELEGLGRRNRYQYRPLETGAIRVLELNPGEGNDLISFELFETLLQQDSSFEALSYEWGDKTGTVPVQCGVDSQLLITPNCKAALAHLRYKDKRRTLWVDAICINQQDNVERNQQVSMMRDIYKTAKSVLLWLGEEQAHTKVAFEYVSFVNEIREGIEKPEWVLAKSVSEIEAQHAIRQKALSALQHGTERASAWQKLCSNSYFTRAWIFQEITLGSSRGTIFSGSHQCSWVDFRSVLDAYRNFGLLEADSLPGLIAKSEREMAEKEAGLLRPWRIQTAMRFFQATNPLDKVFAILGVANPYTTSVPIPSINYEASVKDIFVRTCRFLIQSSDEVGVWNESHHPHLNRISGLPSWVVDFSAPVIKNSDNRPWHFYPASLMISTPSTTPQALHIEACLLDRVAWKISLHQSMDIYEHIVKPAVLALSQLSLRYDGQHPSPPLSTLGMVSGTELTHMNVMVLLKMLFSNNTPVRNYTEAFRFFTWEVSTDATIPVSAKPSYALQERLDANALDEEAMQDPDFRMNKRMEYESILRFGSEIILTERGHFGLLTHGTAEDGMIVALVTGAQDLCMLRVKADGAEQWYEYVDKVFMYHQRGVYNSLEELDPTATIERIEIR